MSYTAPASMWYCIPSVTGGNQPCSIAWSEGKACIPVPVPRQAPPEKLLQKWGFDVSISSYHNPQWSRKHPGCRYHNHKFYTIWVICFRPVPKSVGGPNRHKSLFAQESQLEWGQSLVLEGFSAYKYSARIFMSLSLWSLKDSKMRESDKLRERERKRRRGGETGGEKEDFFVSSSLKMLPLSSVPTWARSRARQGAWWQYEPRALLVVMGAWQAAEFKILLTSAETYLTEEAANCLD